MGGIIFGLFKKIQRVSADFCGGRVLESVGAPPPPQRGSWVDFQTKIGGLGPGETDPGGVSKSMVPLQKSVIKGPTPRLIPGCVGPALQGAQARAARPLLQPQSQRGGFCACFMSASRRQAFPAPLFLQNRSSGFFLDPLLGGAAENGDRFRREALGTSNIGIPGNTMGVSQFMGEHDRFPV